MAEKEAQVTLKHGDTLTITFAKAPQGPIPVVERPFVGSQTPHRRPEMVRSLPQIIFRFFDFGTHYLVRIVNEPYVVQNEFGGYDVRFNAVEKNTFFEIYSEQRPQPDRVERTNYERRLFENYGTSKVWNTNLLAQPRFIENNFQLNADENTTNAGLVVELDGERGGTLEPITHGNPYFEPLPDLQYQRDMLDLLKAKHEEFPLPWSTSGAGSVGLLDPDADAQYILSEIWPKMIGTYLTEPWDTNIAENIFNEGQLRKGVEPGLYSITCNSEIFEHFSMADQHRYSCKKVHFREEIIDDFPTLVPVWPTAESPDAAPPLFGFNTEHSVRADIFLVPQIHRYVTRWLAVYVLIAWFIIVLLYYPTVRSFGLRAGFYPNYYVPAGNPDFNEFVGIEQSDRISKTNTYAAAIVSDANFVDELSFAGRVGTFLIGRIQGEYKIYLRHFEPKYLCAVIRVHRPIYNEFSFGGIVSEQFSAEMKWFTRDLYCVFRKSRIERTILPAIELNGLFTQEVFPWIPNYFESSARHHTDRPGVGI